MLLVLFCILLQKCSLIWITFYAKLRFGTSRYAISSLLYVFVLIYYLLWCSSSIFLSEDIKTNPGPISSFKQCFSICHWNLNSITAHNYVKLSLLTAYNLVKVRLSPSKKNLFYWLHRKTFKSDEKCFLFHFKSSFGFQDI